jgi:tRNA-splicing ligase RtcB
MFYDFYSTTWHRLARALLLHRRWVGQTAQPAGMDGAAGMGRLPRKFTKGFAREACCRTLRQDLSRDERRRAAMSEAAYEFTAVEGGVPIKMWTRGVPVDDKAREQLASAAKMPFIFKHVAAMPDVHVGIGATVGSVIPTKGAVIPAAVGVDIGCGMMAARTSLMAHDLPDNLEGVRRAIELAVPHGRSVGRGGRDKGSWSNPPASIIAAWSHLVERFDLICAKYPRFKNTNHLMHLGTLGTGNHFIELCLDEEARVWVMLHSGSRGVGNAIGTYFIELAKQDMRKWHINLPDEDLAYFPEGTDHFND